MIKYAKIVSSGMSTLRINPGKFSIYFSLVFGEMLVEGGGGGDGEGGKSRSQTRVRDLACFALPV